MLTLSKLCLRCRRHSSTYAVNYNSCRYWAGCKRHFVCNAICAYCSKGVIYQRYGPRDIWSDIPEFLIVGVICQLHTEPVSTGNKPCFDSQSWSSCFNRLVNSINVEPGPPRYRVYLYFCWMRIVGSNFNRRFRCKRATGNPNFIIT